jgi:hypothetical protein
VSFAKFIFLSSWFVKLLEAIFSCFGKTKWMPSWFAKLLELLGRGDNKAIEYLSPFQNKYRFLTS